MECTINNANERIDELGGELRPTEVPFTEAHGAGAGYHAADTNSAIILCHGAGARTGGMDGAS